MEIEIFLKEPLPNLVELGVILNPSLRIIAFEAASSFGSLFTNETSFASSKKAVATHHTYLIFSWEDWFLTDLASVEVSIRERVRFLIQSISANCIYTLDTAFQSMVTILCTDEFMCSFTFLILHYLILISRSTLTILVVAILIWENRVIGYCIAYILVWKVLILNF